ncbi:uncharacterized protein LOC100889999 [Strongylocentrotus purpuratus]|uniref:Uncharacterized protein n=1 Tax=Strongylocentrotus purpuratus TaxID=7668 RepID=A0A7M7GMB7_STRPU|nr:uncharacterized protein LOC100889999 [Strongylocentrotus purpuratus]
MRNIEWKIWLILPAISCAYVLGQDMVNVRGCPSSINVGTDKGKNLASVEWPEPEFIDTEEQRVIPLRSHAPGDRFFVGKTIVRYTAYYMGTKASCTFNIVVQDNEVPHFVTCPTSVVTTTDPGEAFASGVTWKRPSATDNIRLVEFRSNPPIGSRFLMGVTKVTYWAIDPSGNRGECRFNVIVEDRENPTLHQCPSNMVVNANPKETLRSISWTEPVARDNADVARVTSTHRNGSLFPLGTTHVRYTAEDYSGNTGTCSFFVTLRVRVPDAQIFIRYYTTTSIHIAWPETTDQQASSYLIYVWPSEGREPSASDHLYHGINRAESFASRRLGPLMVGKDYDIKVVVTGANHVMTTRQRTRPAPPHNVSIIPGTITPVAFTLLWKSGNGSFESHEITVRRLSDRSVVFTKSVEKSVNSLHVTGLEPYTRYMISIRTVSGYSTDVTESEEIYIMAKTALMPPSGILVREMTADTIAIMGNTYPYADGDDDEDEIDDDSLFDPQQMTSQSHDAHILFIYSEKGDLFTDVVFNQGVWSYTFRDLNPVTSYTIRVVNNQNGVAFETNSTTKPAPVTDLFLSAIDHSSATVQWAHAIGSRDRYEIILTPAPKHKHRIMPIRTRNDIITFKGLEAGTTYDMRITTRKGILTSDDRHLKITPGKDQALSMFRARESTCLSPIIACGLLGAALLLCVVYLIAVFIFNRKFPAKLRSRRPSENEYENPSHHQYSSYLNSLTNRIALMRRPESNNYNLPHHHHVRTSRAFSRLPRRQSPHHTLQRTQSESVIYYNLSD